MSEPATPRKQALRRTVLTVLACYWIAAFAGTHVPVPHLEELPKGSDKVAHFVMYAGLAFLLGLSIVLTRPLQLRTFAVVLATMLLYAVVDELLQIPVNRSADFADGAADVLGALTGLSILRVVHPLLLRLWNGAA